MACSKDEEKGEQSSLAEPAEFAEKALKHIGFKTR
jgi:hypothetical protein